MREIKNLPASVRAKLYEISKQEGIDFQVILTLYMQERLLYRLSQSRYFEKFIIKGGLLLFGIELELGRPTRDIDFLGKALPSDLDLIKTVFREIASTKVHDDGVRFDPESVRTDKIKEDADYEGVRVKMDAYLDKATVTLQIDIGFGDVIVPDVVEMDFPAMLDLNDPPVIKAYSLESVLAEKLEAAVKLSLANGRMKDFYDIYAISIQRDFDGTVLYEAIKATFEKRLTPFDRTTIVFRDDFWQDEELRKRWNIFVRRIDNKDIPAFDGVMKHIHGFLFPVYESLCSERDFINSWDHKSLQWKPFDTLDETSVNADEGL